MEVLRILLKHPYQRQPCFAIPQVLTYASNYTICDSLQVSVPLEGIRIWDLESNLCFEEYYERILERLPTDQINFLLEAECAVDAEPDAGTDGQNPQQNTQKAREQSELWEEDLEHELKVNELIENAQSSNGWGTIPGNMMEKIIASMRIDVDYRKMLCFYRTSIL